MEMEMEMEREVYLGRDEMDWGSSYPFGWGVR
jgi:hypothetical protein